MTDNYTYEVVVPPAFWNDHVARDLLLMPEYSWTRKTDAVGVHLELHWVDVAELHSDAIHYSHATQFAPSLFGLCRSATATVKRLERQLGRDILDNLAIRYKRWDEQQRQAFIEAAQQGES